MLTARQARDLREIADAWDVPAGTAAFALVESQLARARGRKPDLGNLALPLVCALDALGKELPPELRPRSSFGGS